jgi:plastocyanin
MEHQHEQSTSRHRRAFSVVRVGSVFAAGAIVLAACGGGGGGKAAAGNDMAGMNMNAAGAGKAGNNAKPVATNAVRIKNFAFSPATITVAAGSTVVWTNADVVGHDVTFDGGGIASHVLDQNDTFSHTFPTAGTYQYICTIHPFMHGTVIVTP